MALIHASSLKASLIDLGSMEDAKAKLTLLYEPLVLMPCNDSLIMNSCGYVLENLHYLGFAFHELLVGSVGSTL